MSDNAESADSQTVIWILVDHSSREEAFQSVADHLVDKGARAEIVTITEVIGSAAREALTGGAERLLRGLRVAFKGRQSDEDFIGAIRRASPDLLVLTSARYVRPIGLIEAMTGISALHVGVLIDYNVSRAWTQSPLSAFVVGHEEFQARFTAAGVAPERVLVAGPAIQARFAREIDRDAERASLGLSEDVVCLVRGVGIAPSSLSRLLFQCSLAKRKIRYVFHHEGDGAVAAALRRGAAEHGMKAVMFGKVPDLERYVVSADFVITAPSDPYMAELVALDRPLLLVGDPTDAVEQVDFLVRQGVATHVADLLRLGAEIDRFAEPASLQAAVEAGARLSALDGSQQVADALLVALERRAEWSSNQEQPVGTDDAPPVKPPPAGAFESIGDTAPGQEGRGSGAEDDTPPRRGISKSAAKEELAALILAERDLERKLDELERQQERWRNRLDLAREWNEDDLAEEASEILRAYLEEAKPLQNELAGVRQQKAMLKQAAHGQGPGDDADGGPGEGLARGRIAEIEERFRKMEVDSDLEGLKDRIRREFGE